MGLHAFLWDIDIKSVGATAVAIASFFGLGQMTGGWAFDAFRNRQLDVRRTRKQCRDALRALEHALDSRDPNASPLKSGGLAGQVDAAAREVCAHCHGRPERSAAKAALRPGGADAKKKLSRIRKLRWVRLRH